MTEDQYFSTPGGVMKQLEVAVPSKEPAHWYIDRDQRFRVFRDSAVKKTRPPVWVKQTLAGERAAAAKRTARKGTR